MSNVNLTIDISNPKTLKKLIKGFQELEDNINKSADEIVKELAEDGLKHLNDEYDKSPNKDDPNIDFSGIKTSIEEVDDGYQLIAEGDDVIYEEYGTGDEGEAHPHPNKTASGLNPYNSGLQIRDVSSVDEDSYTMDDLKAIGITSGKFWRYNKDDVVHYTQGVQAGKEMWNTRNYLLEKIDKTIKKRGEEISGKFIDSIKG